MKFTWKIGGEAGFGIATSGLVFSKIAARSGYHIFDYISYPSLIRGGHNSYEAVVSDEPVHSLKQDIDCLVCLNKETYDLYQDRLTAKSFVIYDKTLFDFNQNVQKIELPISQILTDLKGDSVMKNTVVLGASLALYGIDIQFLFDILREEFEKKGETIVEFNKQFALKGYEYIKEHYSEQIQPILKSKTQTKRMVLTGNDAFSLGSVIADCRLYASYPMTPSSSVLATLAGWQDETGMVVRHSEDEIAAVNTVLGASFAGVRASTGTSGGGFALMVESIAYAGMAELPLVIFLAQPVGPAPGRPTWTEQADLLFSVFAGHGEFPKIVLAPGDQQEMIELTAKAYNLADIYQTPVLILSDMYLSESHKTVELSVVEQFINVYTIQRGKTVEKATKTPYLRYALSSDGISERLIPGTKGYFYQSNSYEHSEDGHTTENAKMRQAQVEKRHTKIKTYLQHDFVMPSVYGSLKESEIVFIAWGSLKGILLEVQRKLLEQGTQSAVIHFTHLYPLDKDKVRELLSQNKRYVLIENNSQAQFGKLLQMETGIDITEKLLKYDGRMFGVEEIIKKIQMTKSK